MPGDATLVVDGLELRAHVARPGASSAPPGTANGRHALVLIHGLPLPPLSSKAIWTTYPELADRLAGAGWVCLTFAARGVGDSAGRFSPNGWRRDIGGAVERLLDEPGVAGVWLCGFGFGGTLAVDHAARDPRVRGVAALGAPSDLLSWLGDHRRLRELAKDAVERGGGDAEAELAGWIAQIRAMRPLDAATRVAPRQVLIVHGSDDVEVPVVDARALADSAVESSELRVITGAGHSLRHDPRAIAILTGWLRRQVLEPV